mmetsp:Transcript_73693/g.195588  ORF Transcript_73693/g.195588 Transcript_73693/m.195588 type:complete len:242 (-) Transcript_73693:918-1643(-)
MGGGGGGGGSEGARRPSELVAVRGRVEVDLRAPGRGARRAAARLRGPYQHAVHQGVRRLVEHHHEGDGDIEADDACCDGRAEDVRRRQHRGDVLEGHLQLLVHLPGGQHLVRQEGAAAADDRHAQHPDNGRRALYGRVHGRTASHDLHDVLRRLEIAGLVQGDVGVNKIVHHAQGPLGALREARAAAAQRPSHGALGAVLVPRLLRQHRHHSRQDFQAAEDEPAECESAQVVVGSGKVALQ